MSELELTQIINKAVEAGKTSQRKSMLSKIFIGIIITVFSTSVITFFTSFYGVKKAVVVTTINFNELSKEFKEFKYEVNSKIDDLEIDINSNSLINTEQTGQIKYIEGKLDKKQIRK